jgi:hypothetical protein
MEMADQIMQGDKALERDIAKAQTAQEIQSLLENAMARSNIAVRDPQTGQFIRRDPLTPAEQDAAAAAAAKQEETEHEFSKTEVIGGVEFTFTASTEVELEQKIGDAYRVAGAVQANPPATQRESRNLARKVVDRNEAEELLRSGAITTAEFLERTDAVGDYLAERGFDVDEAAAKQFEQSWAQATAVFLNSPAGADWPGGQKNLEIIGSKIAAMGLIDAEDKVGALAQAYAEMKEKKLLFDGDYTPEQLNEMTDKASPSEILEAWKEKQGNDPDVANQQFIESFHNGRSSTGLFGR